MKIALCLSGQPRNLQANIPHLIDGLIIPSGITDIFIHTWYDESLIGQNFHTAQPGHLGSIGKWEEDTIEKLKSLSPISIVHEPDKSFDELSHLVDLPSAIQKRLASNTYSVERANDLKTQYEIDNNFKYDLVIKTRIDCRYFKPHNIVNFLEDDWESYLHVPEMYQYMRVNDSYPITTGGSYGSLSDTFAFGTSDVIDKFSSVFSNFEYIYSQIIPYQYGECYFGYHTRYHHNIPIRLKQIEYVLHR